jgi:hypothetical protein
VNPEQELSLGAPLEIQGALVCVIDMMAQLVVRFTRQHCFEGAD